MCPLDGHELTGVTINLIGPPSRVSHVGNVFVEVESAKCEVMEGEGGI